MPALSMSQGRLGMREATRAQEKVVYGRVGPQRSATEIGPPDSEYFNCSYDGGYFESDVGPADVCVISRRVVDRLN